MLVRKQRIVCDIVHIHTGYQHRETGIAELGQPIPACGVHGPTVCHNTAVTKAKVLQDLKFLGLGY
jgi:hypothetical protein